MRLPVFRDGPILTGGGYKNLFRFCHFQRQSGALLHVMVARMNIVAHHAHEICFVGVGWGGIITNVVVDNNVALHATRARYVWCWGGVGRDSYKRCIAVLKKSVKRCDCFQERCSTPRARLVLG